jgi:hypothetical protein
VADAPTATCTRCKEAKPLAAFAKDKRSLSGLRSGCRLCMAKCHKEWREQPDTRERQIANRRGQRLADKVEGLRRYGGVCVCCGEDDVRFLTFDHIDGGGKQHRAEIGSRVLAAWLRRNGYPEGFQVLCWNCNSGRHFNGGICPHQDPDGRTTCAMLDD